LTTIKYQIPVNGFVTLKVYDVLGNEITALVQEEKSAGTYEISSMLLKYQAEFISIN